MQLTSSNQKIHVHRYWLRKNEPPLGYVSNRRYALIGLCVTTLLGIVALLLLIWGFQTFGLLVCGVMMLSCLNLLMLSLRRSGWYEVDANGNPCTFVSRTPPAGITPLNSVSKQQFFQALER